ncbi:secreted RxLR effector protein 161-like [Tasmannia lanceolata]|uniref:secreted RxLR effector protein 161-like n=1 Tax=Tasmannia lanceolata TaxID=3420 RepID=UPI0040629AAA
MDPNVRLLPEEGNLLDDLGRYMRLVGKLIYLAVIHPDISFVIGAVSQHMSSPRTSHWAAILQILQYLKGAPVRGLLFKKHGHQKIEGYTDADWAGSSADAEYRVMAHTSRELIWLRSLLLEIGFSPSSPS